MKEEESMETESWNWNTLYTPCYFLTSRGLGKERTIAYKHLAELVALKRKSEYNITLALDAMYLIFHFDRVGNEGDKEKFSY